ncbi:ecdysteroid-regulated 16 kDa protein-like [Corticium candelabrum]|uniref:ecdysteroid-regulated 16 kDa protein-like n=1 Tax=Corticium candelabrum TaxID=121492 RepID=UPI002E25EC3E|nr:ecdysteroid-regulated 16 kDa protein-like [Corticium candelabrum]
MLALVFAAILTVAFASPTPLYWKPCGGTGKITSVAAEPCKSKICEIKSGDNATMYITFTPNVLVNELESQVYGTVTPFPPEHFPLQNPNCCEDSGLQCPLKANQTVIYHSTIGVPSGLPEVTVLVTWKLVIPKAKTLIACFETEVKVT